MTRYINKCQYLTVVNLIRNVLCVYKIAHKKILVLVNKLLYFADNFNMICAKLFMCVQEEKTD